MNASKGLVLLWNECAARARSSGRCQFQTRFQLVDTAESG